MGFKTARHAFSERKAASSQLGRKFRPDSILLICAAAMAGDGQGSQTGGQDGHTEQSLQSLAGSASPQPAWQSCSGSQPASRRCRLDVLCGFREHPVLILRQDDLARVREEACGLGKKATCSERRQDWH